MRTISFLDIKKWLVESGFAKDFFINESNVEIRGFAAVERSTPTDVTFWVGNTLKSETNAFGLSDSILKNVSAGLIFIPETLKELFCSPQELCAKLPKVSVIVPVANPYHVMVEFLNKFCSDYSFVKPEIAETASVHPTAVVDGYVGDNCYVGPNCVIMAGARLGDNCSLEANVTIYPNVHVGEGCIFQAGSVIGSRGFGFYEHEGVRRMVPHLAGVRIGKNCSFGANMVVAAGFVSPTVIGNNCHFDSMVQIAHNCILGNDIYMASQSAIAGSVTLEDGVEFAGGAKAAGHLTIGKGAHVAAKSGVTKSIAPGKTVAGFPAEDIDIWRRSMVKLRMMGKCKNGLSE